MEVLTGGKRERCDELKAVNIPSRALRNLQGQWNCFAWIAAYPQWRTGG